MNLDPRSQWVCGLGCKPASVRGPVSEICVCKLCSGLTSIILSNSDSISSMGKCKTTILSRVLLCSKALTVLEPKQMMWPRLHSEGRSLTPLLYIPLKQEDWTPTLSWNIKHALRKDNSSTPPSVWMLLYSTPLSSHFCFSSSLTCSCLSSL